MFAVGYFMVNSNYQISFKTNLTNYIFLFYIFETIYLIVCQVELREAEVCHMHTSIVCRWTKP